MNFKNYNLFDITLVKAAVFFGTLCLVSLSPAFNNWVTSIHWTWFLVIGLALAVKPMIKSCKKTATYKHDWGCDCLAYGVGT